MQQNKNILIINDMPGYGKVALAAMLPILSHMGHNIYNLPTALVSNTLDYGKFTILDTTDYMKKSIAVWKELGFSFDWHHHGFLASAEQVDIIRRLHREPEEGGPAGDDRTPSWGMKGSSITASPRRRWRTCAASSEWLT